MNRMKRTRPAVFLPGLFFVFLFTFAPKASSQIHGVTLLYFNDAHELSPVQTDLGKIGGVSRMKTVIDSLRSVTSNSIVIFGGDLGGGTLGGKLFRGKVMVEALNRFPVDVASFGQHDFDYGIGNTLSLIRMSRFPWLSSNIRDNSGNALPGVSNILTMDVGNVTIGFIGLTDKLDTSGGRSDFIQEDIIRSAVEAVSLLSDADYVVALTQMNMTLNEELVRKCPEIDLVFTEETSQYKTRIDYISRIPVVSACGNMGQLVSVAFSPEASPRLECYPISSDIRPHSELEQLVQEIDAEAAKKLGVVIAELPETKTGNKEKTGLIVSEAFRVVLGTDVGLIQGGGLRSIFRGGRITLGDVWGVLPFENKIVSVRLTGKELTDLVTACYTVNKEVALSGFLLEPSEVGSGASSVTLKTEDGMTIPSDTVYTVALPSYLADGGDGIRPIDMSKRIKMSPVTDSDAVLEYLKNNFGH